MRFIMDANTYIHSHRLNYPFDLFPTYWERIGLFAGQGLIAIDKSIYNELVHETVEDKKDILQKWIENDFETEIIDIDEEVARIWTEILNYIDASACYKSEAVDAWADDQVADPWVIATAKAKNLTVVTLEKRHGNLNTVNPTKGVKIPDICDAFNVPCITLQEMLRRLNFRI